MQADRDLLFQENEDQARKLCVGHCLTTRPSLLCVCADINLGHEPELQNGWTRLQEKVQCMKGREPEWSNPQTINSTPYFMIRGIFSKSLYPVDIWVRPLGSQPFVYNIHLV